MQNNSIQVNPIHFLPVETIRALLSNQPVGTEIWVALAWCNGIVLVAYLAAMRVYKRRM